MSYDKWATNGIEYEQIPWRLNLRKRLISQDPSGGSKATVKVAARPKTKFNYRAHISSVLVRPFGYVPTSEMASRSVRSSIGTTPTIRMSSLSGATRLGPKTSSPHYVNWRFRAKARKSTGMLRSFGSKILNGVSKKVRLRSKRRVYLSLKFYISLFVLDGLAYMAVRDYATSWITRGAFVLALWFLTQSLLRK